MTFFFFCIEFHRDLWLLLHFGQQVELFLSCSFKVTNYVAVKMDIICYVEITFLNDVRVVYKLFLIKILYYDVGSISNNSIPFYWRGNWGMKRLTCLKLSSCWETIQKGYRKSQIPCLLSVWYYLLTLYHITFLDKKICMPTTWILILVFQFWDMTKGIVYSEMEVVIVEVYKCFSNTELSILFDFPS